MYLMDYPVIGEPSKYAYANAYLAYLENKLLTQSQFDQLRVANSIREFERMLSDTIYAGYFEDLTDVDIKQVVIEETLNTKREIYEILPDAAIRYMNVFYRKFDYNNLKILIKSRLLGRPQTKEDLLKIGVEDPGELFELFTNENFEDLPFNLDVEELLERVRKSWELRTVDAEVDRAYYRELLETMNSLNDNLILDYFKQVIDLKNILTFIRCVNTGLRPSGYLLEGGDIPLDVFSKYEEEGTDVLITSTDFVNYRSLIAGGLRTLDKVGSYSALETDIRNYMVSILAEFRDHFFTIRPFIRYQYAKQHEINLIKKMFIHLKNKIEFGAVRDRVYV